MPTETQLEQRVAALQSDLNQKDEQIDALEFTGNDRELSRRDWFDEAQRLENENSAIRLQAGGMQIEIDELRTKLADRDALLVAATRYIGNSVLLAQIKAALSTSAELIPRCPGCSYTYQDCREQMDHYLCGLPEPSAPKDWCTTMARPKSKCGCPDCGSSIVQICAPVERDDLAKFIAEKARAMLQERPEQGLGLKVAAPSATLDQPDNGG